MGRVIQVVGYQNSGKTSFVVEYIKAAVKRNLKVGTIKHHGHSEPLMNYDKQKDTGKHREAGASVSLVEGNGTFMLTSDNLNLKLSQLITIYKSLKLDIILIEGFKFESYPKVVLLRSSEDLMMLEKLENVSCLIASFPLPNSLIIHNKVFTNQKDCIEWLQINKVGEIID
ncbi:molybdopterin-guanine dinucleotide biosynthesis protein B [Metabacillus litoralis]|uniref:molybdopterin-guanine dinucleotide biosynthesis protein B n=1 Tax=Metabacillus litoralis TaxID=152268 RepID=UPI001CFE1153|nr:molybdopterin-guanine dinucleotide biosynthesis protein B [Metabacillus litoralis]